MVLVAIEDGTSNHTGSVCIGAEAGTLLVGSNNFFTIEGKLIMVDDGTMEIPIHLNPPCAPGTPDSHSYSPDVLQNNYFFIEGNPVILVGDNYSPDATEVDSAGQSFVSVS